MMTLLFVCQFDFWLRNIHVTGQRPVRARNMAEARVLTREWISSANGGDFLARKASLKARVVAEPM